MLKSYVTTLQADTLTVVCEPQEGHELAVTSLSVSGGANGGYITISIGDFSMEHSIAANGRIVFPFFMGVQENMAIKALANNDGLQVRVSAEEFVVDNPSDEPIPPVVPDPDEPTWAELPLTIIAEEDGATVAFRYLADSMVSHGNFPHLKYKINDSQEWLQYEDDNAIITLPNKGDYVQFLNEDTQWCRFKLTENITSAKSFCRKFIFTKNVSVAGNIRSLVNFEETGCFFATFEGCANLISAKNLVLDFVSAYSFNYLFTRCVNLIEIPKISITDFAEGCFSHMLNGCSSLQNIDVDFTFWDKDTEFNSSNNVTYTSATEAWVSGVSATGTFYKPKALPEEYGVNRIPAGWNVVNVDEEPDYASMPLSITAEESGVTIQVAFVGIDIDERALKYKINDAEEWTSYNFGDVITIDNIGDTVSFWNETNTWSKTEMDFIKFIIKGKASTSGNIKSLINYSNTLTDYCFAYLFHHCESLISAKNLILDSFTLVNSCFEGFFFGCFSLIEAPKLKNTSLATKCCESMFYYCSQLTEIEVNFTEWHENATEEWVSNVAPTGTFYKPSALPEEYGPNRIPEGWTVVNID